MPTTSISLTDTLLRGRRLDSLFNWEQNYFVTVHGANNIKVTLRIGSIITINYYYLEVIFLISSLEIPIRKSHTNLRNS